MVGLVVAAQGVMDKDLGIFLVNEMIFKGLNDQNQDNFKLPS